MGRGCICAREERRQTHPVGYRRGVVPLVPRDRQRELREFGNREGHQRTFCAGESGPRRTPGRRFAIPVRNQRDQWTRGMAAYRISDAGWQTFFWRDVFSAGGPARKAGFSPCAAGGGGCVQEQ